MKIITEGKVYAQLDDIVTIISNFPAFSTSIPESFFNTAYNGQNGLLTVDDTNRYKFIEFNAADSIEFFKKLDAVIDYDEFKDVPDDEIIATGTKIYEEITEIAEKYNAMDSEQKKANQAMVVRANLLVFRMYDLRNFLWFRQGHIKMTLPDGISYPENMVFPKEISSGKKTKKRSKGRIKTLLKHFLVEPFM